MKKNTKKNLLKRIVMAGLVCGNILAYNDKALADTPVDIVMKKQEGSSSYVADPNTYSEFTSSYWLGTLAAIRCYDSDVSVGDTVNSISTSGDMPISLIGIELGSISWSSYAKGGDLTINSLRGGINITSTGQSAGSNNGYVYGIYRHTNSLGKLEINNLSNVTVVNTHDFAACGIGIISAAGNTKPSSVTFGTSNTDGYVKAYSADGISRGILVGNNSNDANSKISVSNVKMIQAGINPSDGTTLSTGEAIGIVGGGGEISFATSGTIIAKSNGGKAYGIAANLSTTTVKGLTGITVAGGDGSAKIVFDAYNDAVLKLDGSTVTATSGVDTVFANFNGTLNLINSSSLSGDIKVADTKTLTLTIDSTSSWTNPELTGKGTVALSGYTWAADKTIAVSESGTLGLTNSSVMKGNISVADGKAATLSTDASSTWYPRTVTLGSGSTLSVNNAGTTDFDSTTVNLPTGVTINNTGTVNFATANVAVNGAVANNAGTIHTSVKGVSITSVTGNAGADKYTFTIPATYTSGDTMLTINGTTALSFDANDILTVNITQDVEDKLKIADTITLIDSSETMTGFSNITDANKKILKGGSAWADKGTITLSMDGKKILFTYTGIECTEVKPTTLTGSNVKGHAVSVTSVNRATIVTSGGATTLKFNDGGGIATSGDGPWKNVYGGYNGTNSSIYVRGNSVTIEESGKVAATGIIYGGYAGGSSSHSGGTSTSDPGNTVTISNTDGSGNWDVKAIYGGYGKTTACYNTVTIGSTYKGTVTGDTTGISVAGGYAAGTTYNVVNISNGTYANGVYGGYSSGGEANYNTVNISGGTFNENVYGGYSATTTVRYNEVDISGGTFAKDVWGGYSGNAGSANYNKVTISGNDVVITGTLSGSNNISGQDYNTLIIKGKGISADTVSNFMNFEFIIPSNIAVDASESMLKTISAETAIKFTNSFSTLKVDVANVVSGLEDDNRIVLVDSGAAITTFDKLWPSKISIVNGATAWSGGKIVLDGNQIVLAIVGEKRETVQPAALTGNIVNVTKLNEASITNGGTTTTIKYNDAEGLSTSHDGPWKNIYGGYSTTTNDVVKGNKVTLSDAGKLAETGKIYGGYSENGIAGGTSSTDVGNSVKISNTSGSGNYSVAAIYGGYGKSGASYNSVEIISAYTGTVAGDVAGGWTTANVTGANANNNTVTIGGGTYTGTVYGGYSKGQSADYNTVEITGGTFGGKIYGGMTSYGTAVKGNTIVIKATGASTDPNLSSAELWGSNKQPNGKVTDATANVLDLSKVTGNLAVKSLSYFNMIKFGEKTGTILLTSTTQDSNVLYLTIDATGISDASVVGDKYVLIASSSNRISQSNSVDVNISSQLTGGYIVNAGTNAVSAFTYGAQKTASEISIVKNIGTKFGGVYYDSDGKGYNASDTTSGTQTSGTMTINSDLAIASSTIYAGAYAEGTAIAKGGTLTIAGGTITGYQTIYAGYSESGSAEGNKIVIIANDEATAPNLAGVGLQGFKSAPTSVVQDETKANMLDLTGMKVDRTTRYTGYFNIIKVGQDTGKMILSSGTTLTNTTIDARGITSMSGAERVLLDCSGTITYNDNTVVLLSEDINSYVVETGTNAVYTQGYVGQVTNKKVSIVSGVGTNYGGVYYNVASKGYNASDTTSGTKTSGILTVNSTLNTTGKIYAGAYAEGNVTAKGGVVNIGATGVVTGDLYAGYSASGTVSDNSVVVASGANLSAAMLHGSNGAMGTDNVLDLSAWTSAASIKSIDKFNTIKLGSGKLSLTAASNLSNATIDASGFSSAGDIITASGGLTASNVSFILASGMQGFATEANTDGVYTTGYKGKVDGTTIKIVSEDGTDVGGIYYNAVGKGYNKDDVTSGAATKGTLELKTDVSTTGKQYYGAFAEGSTTATGGTVKITAGAVVGDVYAGYSVSGDAKNNTLVWEDGTINGEIYGGNGTGSGKDFKTGNTLSIKGSGKSVKSVNNFQNYVFDLTGAAAGNVMLNLTSTTKGLSLGAGDVFKITTSDLAEDATVTLVKESYGSLSLTGISFELNGIVLDQESVGELFALADSNKSITFTNAALDVSIKPAYKAGGNIVEVTGDITATVNGGAPEKSPKSGRNWKDVYGTYTETAATDTSNNKVTITDGLVKGSVYGGYAKDGNVTGNTININGGTINGSVLGGKSDKSGATITGNTINWAGGTIKGSEIKANAINISGTTATYLGTTGTMTADSAVEMTGALTVGDGTEASVLTVTSGLNGGADASLNIQGNAKIILQGTSNFAGTIQGTGDFTNEGTMTFSGDELNLDIDGAGTVIIKEGTSVRMDGSKGLTGGQSLVINGTLDMTQATGTTETYKALSVMGNLTAGTNGKINFGANLAGVNKNTDVAVTAHDRVAVTGTASGTLNLGSVSVLAGDNMNVKEEAYIQLVTAGTNNITIAGAASSVIGNYMYTFSDASTVAGKSAGWIKVVKDYGFTLAEIVRGKGSENKGATVTNWSLSKDTDLDDADANQYKYKDNGTEKSETDIGTLVARTGTSTAVELTINGNGYNLSGGSETKNGITVPVGGTVNVENMGTVSGFKEYFIRNLGTLNFKGDTSTTPAKAVTTTLESAITGDGTMNLRDSVIVNATSVKANITQSKIDIAAGTKLILNADNLSVSGGIANSGTVELASGSLGAGESLTYNCITGGNTIVTGTVDSLAENLVGTNVTAVSGGVLTLTVGDKSAKYDGSLATEGTGIINLNLNYGTDDDYSAVKKLDVSKGGSIKIIGGVATESLADKITQDAEGQNTVVIEKGATYKAGSTNVFNIDASGKATGFKESKINLGSGTLALTDKNCDIAFLQSVNTVLSTSPAQKDATVKVEGNVTSSEPVTTKVASGFEQRIELPTVDIIGTAVNTLVGTAVKGTLKVDGVDYSDNQAYGFSVKKLDLTAGSTGLAITNDKKVVLGGKGDSTATNLITVAGEAKAVNIVVGTTEKVADTNYTKGTLGIGIPGSVSEAGYKLNGNITVNKESKVEVNGNTEISGNVNLTNKAQFTAAENVKVVMSGLDLDDSSMSVGEGAVVETNTLTAGSTQENGLESSITGKVEVKDRFVIDKSSKEGSEAKAIAILIGDETGRGVVVAKKIELGGNIIFVDPAWVQGVGVQGASHVATETTALDGTYVAGQNAILSFGTMDEQKAVTEFDYTGLTWSESNVTAMAYIAQPVDVSNGALIVDGSMTEKPDTVSASGTVTFAGQSLLMVNGTNCHNEAAIHGINSLTVADSSKLYIANGINGGKYNILAGADVDGWDESNIITTAKLQAEVDKTGGIYTVTLRESDYHFEDTKIPAVVEAMYNSKGTAASSYMQKALEYGALNHQGMVDSFNALGNMGAIAGVNHSQFTMANIAEDSVNRHLDIQNNKVGKEIWAEAIHTKEDVNGLGGTDVNYKGQYNGTIVGADLVKNDKFTFGAALSYVKGDNNGNFSSKNETKHTGVTLYGRSMLPNDAAITYDIAFMHGTNDMRMTTPAVADTRITGDQTVNSFSVGTRFEQKVQVGKNTSIQPYVGARWLRMKNGSFTNSLGMNYDSASSNTVIVPLGLSFKAGVENGGWKMALKGDLGYQWNLGNKDITTNLSYNNGCNALEAAFADANSLYAGLGLEFAKYNFTASVGTRYVKGSSTRQNRWFANLAWQF